MESITFYRRMANSNIMLIKKYKYSQIKKLSYDDIIEIYKTNKIDFDLDVIRLKKFIQGDSKKDNIIEDIEDINIPKNDPQNVINNEDNNIFQTEDVNQLVNTEDENIKSDIKDVIQENINQDLSKEQTEDVNQELSREQTENAKYIEEYKNIDENIKVNDNNFNMYYALLLIPLIVFFIFVKK